MPRPLLCQTVTAATMGELRARRDAASGADCVELRLDGVRDLDVAGALAGRRTPVVVTCRPAWEGGAFDGPENARHDMLAEALRLGADFVDVEWRAGFTDLLSYEQGARTVVSHHDFGGVPVDLEERYHAMRTTGARVVKIAVAVTRLAETIRLKALTADALPSVVIGMGAAGVATRILAAHFGSCWTYAGDGVAPGQIPATRMIEDYRFRELRADTAVYGVVGRSIMHSLSPVMHNAAFAASSVDAVYLPLQAHDFDDFAQFATAIGVSGASVTIPFKRDALAACAWVDHGADAVGAVNTLKRQGTSWRGTNTDVIGFVTPLIEAARTMGLTLRGARVAVLGAGGAARAVVQALRGVGAVVTVHARHEASARELAEHFGVAAGPWPVPAGTWDVLVHCTPVGSVSSPQESPMPGGPFGGALVYDLIYAPADTRLMREAREAGCAVLGGLPMLVAQAEQQFRWWTGAEPPRGVMRAAAARQQQVCD